MRLSTFEFYSIAARMVEKSKSIVCKQSPAEIDQKLI